MFACHANISTGLSPWPLKVVLKQQVQILKGDGMIILDALGDGNWRTRRKCDVHSNLKRARTSGERVGEELAGSPRHLTRTTWLAGSPRLLTRTTWLAGSPRHLTKTMLLPAFFFPLHQDVYIKALVAARRQVTYHEPGHGCRRRGALHWWLHGT